MGKILDSSSPLAIGITCPDDGAGQGRAGTGRDARRDGEAPFAADVLNAGTDA